MHRTIEVCLAFIEAFHRCGFNVHDEVHFVTRDGIVGVLLQAQGKEEWPLPLGKMGGFTKEQIDAQWFEAATKWNLPQEDPAGFSYVERKVIWEMNMPQQTFLGLVVQLVQRGYDLPGIKPEVVEAIKKQLPPTPVPPVPAVSSNPCACTKCDGHIGYAGNLTAGVTPAKVCDCSQRKCLPHLFTPVTT